MEHSVILQLKNITKTYSNRSDNGQTLVLDDVSLTLEHGELLGLLGPSGCGKTTLLRIIAGFESISQGVVEIAGKVVCTNCDFIAAEKRNTGMVFQDYALFPHLTVAENIAFGLKNQVKKHSKGIFSSKKIVNDRIRQRVVDVLELVGLTGLQKRYPHQLSGGQQQRISLARALAPQPALILLDEPLSNLDVQVRHRLRAEIRAILKAAGTSAIFVTHDREEALAISDKIAVMRNGKLEQVGTPEEIYLNPQSRFVAEFVTQANFVPAKRENQVWITELGEVAIFNNATKTSDKEGDLMLRQEDILLAPDLSSNIVVVDRQFLGREYDYCVETGSGKRIHARTDLSNAISVGTKVKLTLKIASPRVFPISPNINNQSLVKV
ncbi:ABC transporter ATP-binding protein [Waterburya agarophytonicola K14]|uniref:ABC-type quaternary amine transporter n=1 Tax=Waterburya agarophytonicola KI4 TaxID=2874699 RepID=A0A964BTA6_9CYAN|nr:ABC transporter ATP-binding protein [Waterburya agarophytonicola]MCC0177455.1 ABC transporter ATP-binding protein [Waterburya agarophytonicola KI4]